MVAPSWGSFQKPNQKSEAQPPPDNFSHQIDEFQEEVPGEIVDQAKPEGEKPSWGDFQSPTTYQGEPDPTAEENLLGYAVRNIASNASRLGEQFFGRHGNVEKFGKDILTSYPKAGGLLGWALSELMGPESWERMVRGEPGNQQILPTSENLKEFSQKATQGYTEPKTPGEKKFQGFTEGVGSTISGRTFRNPTVKSIALNNILIPAAADVTKEIVEDLGFGKDKANMAKMAVWFPLSLAANVDASKFAANLMNRGRNGFNPSLTANTPRYKSSIDNVSKNMLQGDPRSSLAQQQLAGINNDISNGQLSIKDLMTRYDAINAAKRDRGLFALNVRDRKVAIKSIDQVRDAVREEIQHLGQSNPQALQDWQNGVRAFSTIHRSQAISNTVEKWAKGPYSKLLSGPAAALFGVGSYGGAKAPLIAGPAAVGAPALYKTGQVVYRMWNDPRLANYYWRAVGAAQSENLPAFMNNYNKLNTELEKSDAVDKKSKSKK